MAAGTPTEAASLGPYRLEEEIGRGGQGVVYRATDTRIGRTVALKLLRGLGPGAEGLLLRFKREAQAASRTDHPGVCAVYDADMEGGIMEPYVVFAEVNSAWDPSENSDQTLRVLGSLHTLFLRRYGEQNRLIKTAGPVPILYFHRSRTYRRYVLGKLGSSGPESSHFDTGNGWLITSGDAPVSSTLHNGTLQLLWHYAQGAQKTGQPIASRWFRLGMAEWLSGVRRELDPGTGEWTFSFGTVREQHVRTLGSALSSPRGLATGAPMTLPELLETTVDTTSLDGPRSLSTLAAQSWALVYFMNHFRADEDGMVLIHSKARSVKGTYRDRWDRYVGAELSGDSGLGAFMRTMNLDERSLETLSTEFQRFQRFMIRKQRLKQIKDGYLVPWNEARDRRGRPSGQPEDDLLPDLE